MIVEIRTSCLAAFVSWDCTFPRESVQTGETRWKALMVLSIGSLLRCYVLPLGVLRGEDVPYLWLSGVGLIIEGIDLDKGIAHVSESVGELEGVSAWRERHHQCGVSAGGRQREGARCACG